MTRNLPVNVALLSYKCLRVPDLIALMKKIQAL